MKVMPLTMAASLSIATGAAAAVAERSASSEIMKASSEAARELQAFEACQAESTVFRRCLLPKPGK
jgi:hypothetical protein